MPASVAWYNFWTGETVSGSEDIDADAPLDRIPLFVRAGSILPMGPEIEYAEEKPDGPIELRVYTGADGAFTLYADEGDNYNYEKGAHATIPIRWSEGDKTLTIGDRAGQYAGMPQHIQFHVVWVAAGHGAGLDVVGNPDQTVDYSGSSISVKEH